MSPNIRVDREVYRYLQDHALPFVDTPNKVLRRILKLDPETATLEAGASKPTRRTRLTHRSRTRGKKRGPRMPAGVLLPESAYAAPLLSALAERGGSAPASEVIEAVGEKLDGKLTEADRGKLASGMIRWQNRVQFVRLKLIDEGLLAKDSPRGIWTLTNEGLSRVRSNT